MAPFLRAELSFRAAWTLVTVMRLFFVYCEKLKLKCCGVVCALPNGRLFMCCEDSLAFVVSDSGVLEVSFELRSYVPADPETVCLTSRERTLEHDVLNSVCELPDGRIFTGWSDGRARVFSSSGVEWLTLEQSASSVVSVCVLPDGRLFTGSEDGTARVFSDSGIEILKWKIGGGNFFKRMLSSAVVCSVCALPGGRILTGCSDGFARDFSDSGVELLKLNHGGSGVFSRVLPSPVVRSVCALPCGRVFTGCSDGLARVCSDNCVESLALKHGASFLPSARCPADDCSRGAVTVLRACFGAAAPNLSR